MDARLIALKLSLDELQIEFDISSIDKRKIIQKGIYLGQVAGTDIGYRFIWDQMGPYSGDLARDYHALAADISVGDMEFKTKELQDSKKKVLDDIRPLMNPPEGIDIERASWLELIASLHYLKKVVGLDEGKAKQKIETDKNGIYAHADLAINELKKYPSLRY
jgi:uncharacterized protein YwgA